MNITDLKNKLSPIFRNYGIKQAAVFGSVSRGEDRPNSDVDLLVKLGDQPMGMFKYMGLIEEIEEKLGKKVDLLTEGSVNKFLEPYITPDLKNIYEG
ncbi:MAG: nucleotidyltransferase family protein [Candidatus Levyibacteriota bacterium]|nr:MAG: nucleotidyltransferase family protein [Candidatus Levybacteria bacterium]